MKLAEFRQADNSNGRTHCEIFLYVSLVFSRKIQVKEGQQELSRGLWPNNKQANLHPGVLQYSILFAFEWQTAFACLSLTVKFRS